MKPYASKRDIQINGTATTRDGKLSAKNRTHTKRSECKKVRAQTRANLRRGEGV
jgi:hypothetical protein